MPSLNSIPGCRFFHLLLATRFPPTGHLPFPRANWLPMIGARQQSELYYFSHLYFVDLIRGRFEHKES